MDHSSGRPKSGQHGGAIGNEGRPPSGRYGERPKRILVVDDAEEYLTLIRSVLHGGGFEVVTLTDASLIFSRIFEIQPDALLLDVEMPGFDGPMVARMLRKLDKLRTLPIFLCSAVADERGRALAEGCGATGFLSKSRPARELLKTLRGSMGMPV